MEDLSGFFIVKGFAGGIILLACYSIQHEPLRRGFS